MATLSEKEEKALGQALRVSIKHAAYWQRMKRTDVLEIVKADGMRLRELTQKKTPHDIAMIVEYALWGYSVHQIGELVNLPVQTVRYHLPPNCLAEVRQSKKYPMLLQKEILDCAEKEDIITACLRYNVSRAKVLDILSHSYSINDFIRLYVDTADYGDPGYREPR